MTPAWPASGIWAMTRRDDGSLGIFAILKEHAIRASCLDSGGVLGVIATEMLS